MNTLITDSQKAGMPPGTIIYVGKNAPEETSVDIISYDARNLNEQDNIQPATCIEHIKDHAVCWINVTGLKDSASIQNICAQFNIHPLIIEDILNTHQRPKVEFHSDYIYVCLKMLYSDSAQENGAVSTEQISLILGKNYVLSFQEVEGDVFNSIRDRIRGAQGRIRTQSADYLLYCLVDAIVDNYFLILENVSEGIEMIQDLVLENDPTIMRKLHSIKRDIISIRRFVWPARDLLNSIEKSDHKLIGKDIHLYLRDVSEHALRAIETIEMYREMATGAFEIHLSSISNRMNEIMRILTIISTFFIPLTFLAGIYGMNFKHMPELEHPMAYPALLGIMLVIAACMALFFRRKKWI